METDLAGKQVLVTGGSRGLGRAMVESLFRHGAKLTVLARDRTRLREVEAMGVNVRVGDVTDSAVIGSAFAEVRPAIAILNAGATPQMGPLTEQTWESFSTVWNTDVKAGLHGIQAALKTRLPNGARVWIMSSGAATVGAPWSGSYSGAKRMLWFMARHANEIAKERGQDVCFQVIVPMQMIGETDLVKRVAGAYAQRQGISVESLLISKYGPRLSAEQFGDAVMTLLSDPRSTTGLAYGVKAETGITCLEE